jgi:hypothetical protein
VGKERKWEGGETDDGSNLIKGFTTTGISHHHFGYPIEIQKAAILTSPSSLLLLSLKL